MPFNVLSLFDGMSCGQIALRRAGIHYDQYFASEIDPYAIQVTQANYSDTIQLGDVRNVKGADLPKIDLLCGGSPCVGFSTSGKGLNFEDPQSKLFFEYVRLLKECKPRYFLLENVRMKKEWENTITNYMQMNPIKINSSLVSAQSRVRLYWTNIPGVTQPKDRYILLGDILQDDSTVEYEKELIVGVIKDRLNIPTERKPIILNINDSNTGMSGRVLSKFSKKSHTLTASGSNWIKYGYIEYNENGNPEFLRYRRLTSDEWVKLQTVSPDYISDLSDGHKCRLLGNGWTVDIIAHIFSNLKGNPEPKQSDLNCLFPLHEILGV